MIGLTDKQSFDFKLSPVWKNEKYVTLGLVVAFLICGARRLFLQENFCSVALTLCMDLHHLED